MEKHIKVIALIHICKGDIGVDSKERVSLGKIKKKINEGEDIESEWLKEIIQDINYENILSQKILLKIVISSVLDNKVELYSVFINKYTKNHVREYILFVDEMSKIEKDYKLRIQRLLISNFNGLFDFLNYFNQYIRNYPEVIRLAKRIVFSIAEDCLPKDFEWNNKNSIIEVPTINPNKLKVIDDAYKLGVQYGCIEERLDSLNYGREEVIKYKKYIKPAFYVEVNDWKWSQRVAYATNYYKSVSDEKLLKEEYKTDPLYNFYKCLICKKSFFSELGVKEKLIITRLMEYQFSAESLLDYLLRHTLPTGNIVTYLFSAFLYLYIRVLEMMINGYRMYEIISWDDLRSGMFWGRQMSDDEFKELQDIGFVDIDKDLGGAFCAKLETGIIIAPWMYDFNLSIFQLVTMRFFSNSARKKFGKEVDYFGKSIIESFVKGSAERAGWQVLKSSLKIKKTDFDIVMYKDGIVIIGQIKANHCDASLYSLWKANEVINYANEQIKRCKLAVLSDKNLLFSNLKREGIIKRREDIKDVLYIIVSGSGYIAGDTLVPVISMDDWLNFVRMDSNKENFDDFLQCPPAMYKLKHRPEYQESVIDTPEFEIFLMS